MPDTSAASIRIGGMLTGAVAVELLAAAMVDEVVSTDGAEFFESKAQAEAAIRAAVAAGAPLYLTCAECTAGGLEVLEEVCDRLGLEYIGWQDACPGCWESEVWRCGAAVAEMENGELVFASGQEGLPMASLEDLEALEGCSGVYFDDFISEMRLCTPDSLPPLSMLS
jgi:hypothetical protein